MNDSIQLPGAAVHQAAIAVAKRRKMWAAICFVLAGVFGLGFASLVNDPKQMRSMDMSREQVIGGGLFWIALLVMIAMVHVFRARKVMRTGALAASDPRTTWWLQHHTIVGADAQGVPQTAHTFKISSAVHATLTAFPRLPPARTFQP